MKCPECSAELNRKLSAQVVRPARIEILLCGACGALAGVTLDDNPGRGSRRPCLIDPCASCGAPVLDPEREGTPECEVCGEGPEVGARGVEEDRETARRVFREACALFQPLPPSRSFVYFERILADLTVASGHDWQEFRLVPVSGLGFGLLSLPGGEILAGRELLGALEDEAMLAFFVAREIALLLGGRVVRRFRERRAGPLSASLEWGLSLITGGAPAPGRNLAARLREVAALGYGRAHEEEADAFAVDLLVATNYDPTAACRALDFLQRHRPATRTGLSALLERGPDRSRRAALVELLVRSHTDSPSLRRVNREVYRRALAGLSAGEAPAPAGVTEEAPGAGRPS